MQKSGQKTSMTTKSGKERLGPLTLKQLAEKSESAKGKKRDRYLKEVVRKTKMGLTYKEPTPKEESSEESETA